MPRSFTGSLLHPQSGWGLGLRTSHYPDFLAAKQPLDWLEIITDNYLGAGGRPLHTLEKIRRDYPLAMHGVAMNLASSAGVDIRYLKKVKALADRIEPMWISDHLCWTAPPIGVYFHDLLPFPYTDENARHVIDQIRRAQEVLGRRLVVENLSSYIEYQDSAQSEWEFLCYVLAEADCLLLLDVNNIYVSGRNHGFDPLTYLKALPADRIQQIHLAGHSSNGDDLIDTHDQPVTPEVWQLFQAARRLFGPRATMIERDDNIPPLPDLLQELAHARQLAMNVDLLPVTAHANHTPRLASSAAKRLNHPLGDRLAQALPAALETLQINFGRYVLTDDQHVMTSVRAPSATVAARRLHIYHHAFRARLVEVLAECFPKTVLYMGTSEFEKYATQYVEQTPPDSASLATYGATLADFFNTLFPSNPELSELAQLEWQLRRVFDAADPQTLNAKELHDSTSPSPDSGELAQTTLTRLQQWLTQPFALQSTACVFDISCNVATIWRAIDADQEVPAPQPLVQSASMLVWRKDLQPQFQTIEGVQRQLILQLLQGDSINDASQILADRLDAAALGQFIEYFLPLQLFAAHHKNYAVIPVVENAFEAN